MNRLISTLPDICGKFREIFKNYDSFWMTNEFTVILHDPDDIKTVLNSEETFEKTEHVRFYFKSGLLPDGGTKYRFERKRLIPLLRPSNLWSKLPIINKEMDIFFNDHQLDGQLVDACDLGMQMSNRATIKVFFDSFNKMKNSELKLLRHYIER